MLFDSHAHLTHDSFNNDREAIIQKFRDLDIKIISVGNGLGDSRKAIDLAKKYPGQIWASAGIHPSDSIGINFDWNEFKNLAKDRHIIAIGECGLDYYNLKSPQAVRQRRGRQTSNLKIKDLQKEVFIKQIELAQTLKKPLILHCRPTPGTTDAYEEAIEILKFKNFPPKGVAHFFSGSKAIAKQFLDLGFYISFAGPITFASQYQEIVGYIPLNRILVETDAPFAAPAPYRGKRNEPAYVEFVARQIAEWKGIDFESVARRTTENTITLYCLE
ncbi:MAG: TatD family hydrolase [Candidatus Azambacteria bacterium]|nr:TatD family hydrolase [Candidatus Azambacteria bacterium]